MTNLQSAYNELIEKYQEISVMGSIAEILHWDMQTMMPPKGGEKRGRQLALIAGLQHERMTAPRVGELLADLTAHASSLSPDQAANVREIARDYAHAVKVPRELVEELSRHQSLCHEVWVKAREAADFDLFAPQLEKMVRLTAEQAECLGYRDTPLDALIDLYEPDATTAMFTRLFDEVKAVTVPLLRRVMDSPVKADHRFLGRTYSTALQKQFGEEIMRSLGFDLGAGRLDTSVHPFCGGSYGDVRITTRYNENAPQQAIFGIIHETGHALYEQGVDEQHLRTPLAEARSYGVHESQSRLWENFVGRSRPFWAHFLPKMKNVFPSALSGVSLDQFVLAINRVQPSLVRVEADEMTYDLHIILRFEIERDLFAGTVSLGDLPATWNRRMESYLGVVPPDNGKQGVLQDVHWSGGMFGYFPSYSLGNIVAAQLWYAMRRAMPDMERNIERGRLDGILTWLRENIHHHGRRYSRDELLTKATGKPFGPEDYARYLTEKYSALYHL